MVFIWLRAAQGSPACLRPWYSEAPINHKAEGQTWLPGHWDKEGAWTHGQGVPGRGEWKPGGSAITRGVEGEHRGRQSHIPAPRLDAVVQSRVCSPWDLPKAVQ